MSVSEPIVDESENLAGSHSYADYVWYFLSNALPILAIVLATATLTGAAIYSCRSLWPSYWR
jgi:hypothetical protein